MILLFILLYFYSPFYLKIWYLSLIHILFLIQTGTAPGDIHVADRLSQTSCLFHPDFLPQVKKISTLSDRHLPAKAVNVKVAAYTASAKEKIEKAGGKAEVI